MNIETRKLNLIQELLKVEDISVLKQVEAILAKRKSVRKSFVDLKHNMTLEEANEFERLINEGRG
jgi:hypothetical protein